LLLQYLETPLIQVVPTHRRRTIPVLSDRHI
jgi:hypothetical protein